MVDLENLREHVGAISHSIAQELERDISIHFDKCGIFYRIFSRCKSADSTVHKIEIKEIEYEKKNKKMQDLLGIRLVLYFKDDIDLCIKIIENNFQILEIVRDEEKSEEFRPMRLNIVCRMPNKIVDYFAPDIWDFPIDKTFEIQIRTIFSEGWHEVEHDLRYKHKEKWIEHAELSRNLNGIFATLETCDWAILNVLDQLTYQKYKVKDWDSMLRNHLRIRMDNNNLSAQIVDLFNENHLLAKEFYKVDRKQLLLSLSEPTTHTLPKNIDNIVFLINGLIVKNTKLSEITPQLIKKYINQILKNANTEEENN